MTEFEQQVAKALGHALDEIARVDFKLNWDDPLPKTPLAARLAPRVAAAIEAAMKSGIATEPSDDESPDTLYLDEIGGRDAALAALRGAS